MTAHKIQENEKSIPFYPDHVRSEFRVVVFLLVVVFIFGAIGFLIPVGLGDPADPMDTPAHTKPEWYFLSLYQVLKFIPKTAGAVFPVLGLIVLTILPFLDNRPEVSPRTTRIRFWVSIAFVVLLIALTVWGEWS